jgi:formylglycine-generating enzyme required for sulfatase activity
VWFVVAQMASWRARSNLSHAGETQRQLTEQLQQERAQREAHRTTLAKLDEQLTKLQAQRDALRRKLNTAPAWTGTQAGQERDDNGLKLKLCWCPPGTFTMGSPAGESGRYSDENQVSVTLSRGFWLGKYEVTQGEWQAVMGSNPSGFSSSSSQAPVETVSWDEATEFCRKLTEQEHQAGRLPADWEYRLPTEAQWEYACRAGSTTRYAFGDSESELDKYAWYYINSGSKTHSVGEKQPNGWGLHDMYGNVWEWCRDWYSYTLPGGTDAEGPATASDRVHRGGSWYISAAYCRSAPRGRDSPEDRSDDLGFRLAAVQSAR